MDPAIFVFVLLAVLLASAAQMLTGFGFALVAVPFLLLVVDVRETVVITTLLSLMGNVVVARGVWRDIPWRTVSWLAAGSFVGMPFGLAVLLLAPEDALKIGVGLATMAMAAALGRGLRFGTESAASGLGVGVISGVLKTSTSINGPPVVLYLQGLRHSPDGFRGALSVFFFVTGIVTLLVFAASGVLTARALWFSAASLPVVFIGAWLGHALLRRVDVVRFRRIVFVLLLAAAISAVITSALRLWA